jgi:hypothetical protein
MAKSNPNFYLLQEDSGEIIGIVGTPNIKERVRNALQDYFNNKEIDIEDIHCLWALGKLMIILYCSIAFLLLNSFSLAQ